jgi:hypothetical protein
MKPYSPDYARKWALKKAWYAGNGILPHEQGGPNGTPAASSPTGPVAGARQDDEQDALFLVEGAAGAVPLVGEVAFLEAAGDDPVELLGLAGVGRVRVRHPRAVSRPRRWL